MCHVWPVKKVICQFVNWLKENLKGLWVIAVESIGNPEQGSWFYFTDVVTLHLRHRLCFYVLYAIRRC